MKKLFIALSLVFILLEGEVFAQSCCCTGAGANYSILPNLNKNVLGIRYSYRNYFSETRSLNPEINGTVINQHLNSLEIFGRFNLTNQLQLSVFAPVNFISQQSSILKQKTGGLGDMSFLLQYNLLDPLKCSGKKSKHQLRLGTGVKLPSGEFKMDGTDMFSTNLQLGTGSVDFIFSTIYIYRFKNFGFNTSAGYRLNTVNTQQYRFGDKFQSGLNVFYVFELKSIKMMPSLGLNYEHQFENRKENKLLEYTGGNFLNTSVGFDVYYKQFAFSSAFIPALMNQLNWHGENKNKLNFEVGLFYNFSITKQ